MANIRGLIGFNPSFSLASSKLFAAYGPEIIDVSTGLGIGFPFNSSNDMEFSIFLDSIFMQNYANFPLTYSRFTSSSNSFSWGKKHVGRTPISKYLKPYKSRMYLGNCKFIEPQTPVDLYSDGLNLIFPSRVFHSDFFTGTNTNELTWGIEWGRNGRIQSGTNILKLETQGLNYFLNQNFVSRNIKVGDPLTITTTDTPKAIGELVKTHLVTKIRSPYELELNTIFTGLSEQALFDYWVGSNWFDVSPDDGDEIKGLGENNDRLLIFKLMSLWFYTGSQLKQVQGAVGTSYNRSIINDRFGNTYYFHGSDPKISGIYKYNGVGSIKISRGIDPWILAMDSANYDNVVAWAEGNELRWYIGNLSANNYIEAMTNAVASLNLDTGAWSVDPIQDVITVSTTFRTNNVEDTYTGTSDDEILQMDDGNSHNGTPITALLETKVYYPAGTEVINEFPWIQIISRNAKGVKVKYKLWDHPTGVDKEWWGLGQIEDDKTEFPLSNRHYQASGIQFRFEEMGIVEKDAYIEKITIFYKPDRSRLL